MKRLLVGLLVFGFLLFPKAVFATHKVDISSDKTSLSADEEMHVSLQFSGFDSGQTISVKGAFFQEGSTNYFGLSKNGDSWIKNSGSVTSQPTVSVSSSPQVLTIKNDPSDSGFHGDGDYKFKVGYYYTTSGGNLSSINWSDTILSIHLSSPPPTSSPTPSPSPTPTFMPTPTVDEVLESDQVTPEDLQGKEGEASTPSIAPERQVLFAEDKITPTPSDIPVQVQSASTRTTRNAFPMLLGLGILVVCVILICRKLLGWRFPFEQ